MERLPALMRLEFGPEAWLTGIGRPKSKGPGTFRAEFEGGAGWADFPVTIKYRVSIRPETLPGKWGNEWNGPQGDAITIMSTYMAAKVDACERI